MSKTYWGGMATLALLASIPLFMRLESLPLFIFDEARLANNALEMALNGNWIVTYYNGEPDLWNTKPPLLIWIQVLFIKIFGFDTLGLRLPSALAGLATILASYRFIWRQTRSVLPALASGLVLVCVPGYVALHVTRTGDYDALLALWTTLFLLHFYNYLQAGSRKYIWYALAFFTLAVLTKGITVFLFLPALFMYLLARRRLWALLRQPHFYYAALASAGAIAAFYLGREAAAPGYLKAVAENELWGRYLQVIESHQGPWYFYLQKIWESEFSPWTAFLPLALWCAFRDEDQERRPLWGFLLWHAIGFFIPLSFSETKIAWYAAPAFPLLAMAVGGSLGVLAERAALPRLAPWLLVFGILTTPYAGRIEDSYRLRDNLYNWEKRLYASMMKDMTHWPVYAVSVMGYNAHIDFYVKKYRMEGQDISVKSPHAVGPGEFVLICEEEARSVLRERMRVETMFERKGCGIYQTFAYER